MIRCILENNNQTSFRHVVVTAIVVNDKNEVLIIKRAPHLPEGNKFGVPGGFLDRDEDTKQAVIRELQEETGYTGEVVKLFRINDSPKRDKEDRQNVDFIYIAKVTGGEPKLNNEVTQISWIHKDSLPKDEEFAFDHKKSVELYLKYLEKPFDLPVMGAI
jgi:mutator protein MutT